MKSIFDVKRIHFIGIGGISMSSIAHILLDKGLQVSGSDQVASKTTNLLQAAGAKIYIGHEKDHIKNQDLIIYTGAISKDNPEVIAAMTKKIPLIQRTKALNDILKCHRYAIAISGTHGKSTTSSMVAQILRSAYGDISYLIGAHLNDTKKAYHLGSEDYITVEACEYQANFLNIYPSTIVINNIEPEHMDYYKSTEQLVDTFRTFANHLPDDGHLILNIDDYNTKSLCDFDKCTKKTFGIRNQANYMAKNINIDVLGCPTFDLYIDECFIENIHMKVIGDINVYNALAAIAATHSNGVALDKITDRLANFNSPDRRFENVGNYRGAVVISDYAHHPTAVIKTLASAAKIKGKKICVVFQPHTYSRTRAMLAGFASSFKNAHHVIITDIYAARECNTYNIHAKDLVNAIREEGQNAQYVAKLEDLPNALKNLLSEDTLLIMMGAGNIDQFTRKMISSKV